MVRRASSPHYTKTKLGNAPPQLLYRCVCLVSNYTLEQQTLIICCSQLFAYLLTVYTILVPCLIPTQNPPRCGCPKIIGAYGRNTTMTTEVAALPAATLDVNGGIIGRPLAEVCAEVAGKVNSFLESDVEGQVLKDVQAQTRIALGVIEECLQKYR